MKRFFAVLLCALMLLSLCACGQSAQSAKNAARGDSSYSAYDMPAEAPMAAEESYWESEEAYGGFAVNSTTAALDDGEPKEPAEAGAIDPEKIIYSASATVETTEFDDTLTRLETLIAQVGGFIESSSVSGNNYYSMSRGYASSRSASYTVRVPSRRFQELMGSLSTLGNVPYSNTYTENITSRYYDTEARLTAYRTQEQRLLEMMELAETVSDLIVIEDRLTELRYQIESLQSTLNNWDRQVSYSTIYVSVNEVTVYTPEATMTYGQQLGLAVRNGLQSAVDFLGDALLWLLEALPMLIILAVLVLIIVLICKKSAKKRREKKQRQWQQMQAQQAQQNEK